MRLDIYLVQHNLVRSRSEAQELIKAGNITVNGIPAFKSSLPVSTTDTVAVLGERCPYVSRGGLKLAQALSSFDIAAGGKRCLDIGISTGGFTDCLLQHGACHVTGIDVGHGQLSSELQGDLRIELREGVNARSIAYSDFNCVFNIITIDISFISVTHILPVLPSLIDDHSDIILLVKPQFEVGPAGLDKKGIVRDKKLHDTAILNITDMATSLGLSRCGLIESPITGGDGNREYLMWLRKTPAGGILP